VGLPLSKATPHIVKFDKRMQPIAEMNLEEMDRNSGFMGISEFGNKVYIFSYTLSDRYKTISYYAQALNTTTLKADGEKKVLASFDYISSNIYAKNIMLGSRDVTYKEGGTLALSPDSSKLLFIAEIPSSEKGTDNLHVIVFEKDMKKSWEKNISLPTPSNLSYITNFYVTNNGQVCIALREFKKKIDRFRLHLDEPNFDENVFKIIVCDKVAAISEQSFNVGSKFVHSLSLNSDAKNNLVFFGLFQTVENGNINGYFLVPFDPAKKGEYNPTLIPFPQKICDQVLLDKQSDKKDDNAGIGAEFYLKQVLTSDDGSCHYLLEYLLNHNSIANVRGGTGSVGVAYTIFGDVLDVRVAADETKKVFRIPRRERIGDFTASGSFNATTWNNKIILFEYSFESNLTMTPNDEAETKGRGGTGNHVAIMTVIDDLGNIKKSIAFSDSDEGLTPSFAGGTWLSKTRLVLNAYSPLRIYTQTTKAGLLELK
jgi:hypothetical protein